MRNLQRNERVLIVAACLLLLSILLMIAIIPGVYTRSLANATNPGAVIGISLAIIVRLLVLFGYISIIKRIRRGRERSRLVYIVIGVLLIIFGLIYSDGAFAFLNNENIQYVSVLMFSSVFCDIIASVLTFIASFNKSQKVS